MGHFHRLSFPDLGYAALPCMGSIDQAVAIMVDFTARGRRRKDQDFRNAMALLNAMSPADRADIGIKQADFTRIARVKSA